MTSDDEIESARVKIADLFIQQCKFGAQTTNLPQGQAACGQFLGAPAKAQRGAHGVAAAVLVLSKFGTPEANELVQRMLKYVECEWLGTLPHPDNLDSYNVIKIAETLHALCQIKRGVGSVDAISKNLADKLGNSKKGGTGWGYFTDSPDGQTDELPTAFALRALECYGASDLDSITKTLFETVKDAANKQKGEKTSDIYVHIFSLFVLAFHRSQSNVVPQAELKRLFRIFWRRLSVIREDVEQNLEYWKGDSKSRYVRVPWQLYLLALAAKLAPKQVLTSVAAETRLDSLVSEVQEKGSFRYPHSGDLPSSRTNAILYEVLQIVETERANSHWIPLFRNWNKFIALCNSRAIFWVAVMIIAFSMFQWFNATQRTIAELAPNLLASFLLWLLVRKND